MMDEGDGVLAPIGDADGDESQDSADHGLVEVKGCDGSDEGNDDTCPDDYDVGYWGHVEE